MRTLIETKVLGILNDILEEDQDQVEMILDLDMGFWNADEDPAMSKDTLAAVIKDTTNEELLELHDYLCCFQG